MTQVCNCIIKRPFGLHSIFWKTQTLNCESHWLIKSLIGVFVVWYTDFLIVTWVLTCTSLLFIKSGPPRKINFFCCGFLFQECFPSTYKRSRNAYNVDGQWYGEGNNPKCTGCYIIRLNILHSIKFDITQTVSVKPVTCLVDTM